jgi:hypothetical protein
MGSRGFVVVTLVQRVHGVVRLSVDNRFASSTIAKLAVLAGDLNQLVVSSLRSEIEGGSETVCV